MERMKPGCWIVALAVAVVVAGLAGPGCSGSRRGSGSPGSEGEGEGEGSDPTRQEVQALEGIAARTEADVRSGGAALAELSDQLEQRLTPADVSVVASNYLAMMEAYRAQQPWAPDADFYAVVDRVRDLPLLSEMPAHTSEAPSAAEDALAVQSSAIFLNNVTPACGFSCEAQGTLYALLDFGAGEVKQYCADLLFSGVDCMQDAAKLGQCAAAGTCTWGDFTLFAGGCASLSLNVGLEVTGARKVKTAYVFLKKVLTLWSVGALTSQLADWVAACHDHEASDCPAACGPEQKACLATNGAGSTCCAQDTTCTACTLCPVSCGIADCCAAGQRCKDGQCDSCVSPCGATCCGAQEICANPDQGVCAPCANPCGLTCCPGGTTCLESMHECCATPCGTSCCGDGETCLPDTSTCCKNPCGGDQCCGDGESCVGAPAACCKSPCGDRCCADGEVCNPATSTCGASAGCGSAPPLDCSAMCAQAVEQAVARCNAMGGTMDSTDPSGCISGCQCLVAAVPNLSASAIDPSCPGCDGLQAAVERCGQSKLVCKVPQ